MSMEDTDGRAPGLDGTSDGVHSELDRRVYHLRTLYDVSQEIFGSVDSGQIVRSFLLMTMGNFGVTQGFVLTSDPVAPEGGHFLSMGYGDRERDLIRAEASALLAQGNASGFKIPLGCPVNRGDLPSLVSCVVPFRLDEGVTGLLGLGEKLVGDPYTDDDRELLETLVNNLSVSLKNARSFERIHHLNVELQDKNRELEKTLSELQAALRKVEILESIKSNLCKFVPATVSRIIETSPAADTFDAKERDVSVMFVDIEGYTKITERLGATEVNNLVERYFSVFMDAIYENNGDVVETSGDGLMVLFLTDDEVTNAVEAVRAARTIREKALSVNTSSKGLSQPLAINIGISSGRAIVGANKFESYTGARWAYTSHGMPVNLAARLCGHARGGSVLAERSTVDRVGGDFNFASLGKVALKNVSGEVEIYSLV